MASAALRAPLFSGAPRSSSSRFPTGRETGVDAAIAFRGLLRELNSQGAHPIVCGAAVSHRQHQGRHCTLGNHCPQSLRSRRIVHRRPGSEQTELEGRLLRMLDRKPAIVTVAHVRMDAEPQLLDVERDCFRPDRGRTNRPFGYPGSSDLLNLQSRLYRPSNRRRFSETAIVRSGRCAARRTQAGTRSMPRATALACTRIEPGFSPVMSRTVRPNVPRLAQARTEGNVSDGKIGFAQQCHCPLNPSREQVAVRR